MFSFLPCFAAILAFSFTITQAVNPAEREQIATVPGCSLSYGSPTISDCNILHDALYYGWPGQNSPANLDRKRHIFSQNGYKPTYRELKELAAVHPSFLLADEPIKIPKISTIGNCVMSWQLLARNSDSADILIWDFSRFRDQKPAVKSILDLCGNNPVSAPSGGHIIVGQTKRILITIYAKNSEHDRNTRAWIDATGGFDAVALRYESSLAALKYEPIAFPRVSTPAPPSQPFSAGVEEGLDPYTAGRTVTSNGEQEGKGSNTPFSLNTVTTFKRSESSSNTWTHKRRQ